VVTELLIFLKLKIDKKSKALFGKSKKEKIITIKIVMAVVHYYLV